MLPRLATSSAFLLLTVLSGTSYRFLYLYEFPRSAHLPPSSASRSRNARSPSSRRPTSGTRYACCSCSPPRAPELRVCARRRQNMEADVAEPQMAFYRPPQSPRDDQYVANPLSPPQRNPNRWSASMAGTNDVRGALHRRFTTNTVPTLSPIGQQRRQAAGDMQQTVSALFPLETPVRVGRQAEI